ncbi:MAG: GntR family transcriptional regulator [Candidatus Cryptobacteroides sp.]|nr:GntR family transcriptional regulator [Bacteroidales bacterium]
MEFRDNKPIYLQISDVICEKILSGELKAEDRLMSVREYGALIGVNPNTMMRTYEKLTDDGVIYNKRGIGYFVCPDARKTVLANERKSFMENELPAILKRIQLLEIDPEIFVSQK